jgi:hypothetical protein
MPDFARKTIFEHLQDHPKELIVALGREGKRRVCVDPQRRPFTAAMGGKFQQPATHQPTGVASGYRNRLTAGSRTCWVSGNSAFGAWARRGLNSSWNARR